MKIVFVTTSEILGSSNDGGIKCSMRNLEMLRHIVGVENVFVCAITKNKDYLSKTTNNAMVFYSDRRKICILKNTIQGKLMYGTKVEKTVLAYINQLGCDAIFFDYSRMGTLQEQLPKNMKQILYLQNVERDYFKSQLKQHPSWLILMLPVIYSEKKAVKNADVIISLNARDASQLSKYYKRNIDLIIPITLDDHFITSQSNEFSRQSQKLQLLFVGSLFSPNEYGVNWFINKVMPHVNAEFTVVGRGFEKLVNKLKRDNVNIVGTVEDLGYYYRRADAIVSPILSGSGMKVKTAEAMMHGKPIFATDEALEGYEVKKQKHIYRCNSPQEFITAINTYAREQSYISFDPEIRSLYLSKYNTSVYLQPLRKLLLGITGLQDKNTSSQ